MKTAAKIILISLTICACSLEARAKYTWACEDQYTSLDCGSDMIDVKVASYGRTDRVTCSSGRPCYQLTNTSCLADSSLSQVKNRCDGRSRCTVPASSLLFSDPCVGTYKYLEVLYSCVPPPDRSNVTCEGQTGTLDCGSHIIQIQAANYGRTDGSTCAVGRDASQINNTNCISTNTLSKVKETCEGRTSCQVEAFNSIFSNPCPGIHKYLNISYSCVPPNSRYICEHSDSRLECGSSVILVHAASYGRTDEATCSAGKSAGQISNTDCLSMNTLSAVRNICEGRTSCQVEASNSIFSNPCPGIHKYLNISYSCVPPKTREICEGLIDSRLECGSKVIQVHAANYGRTDGTTCAVGRDASQINNTNCISTNTLSKVKETCQGKSSCLLTAHNSVFSNPCPGTHKYLNISYSCAPSNSSRICEKQRLNCGSEHFLKIHWAGCSDATTCSPSCHSEALSTVRQRCEGKVTCLVSPCADMCLDVIHTCVPPMVSQACEGNSTRLDCGANMISIHTANYGRTNTHTCSAGLPPAAVSRTNCFTSIARDRLKEQCDRRHTCEVTASNTVFPDECPQTYKYLDITYTCVDPAQG